jgi:hypothetical protein
VSNGSSKNDITMDTLRTRGPSKEYDEGYARIFGTKAPQAECAPQQTDAEALYEAWQNTIKHMDAQAECAPPPKQEALGEPFQTVLDENRWNLYAEEKPKGMKGCGKCDDDPAECAWHQQCQAECAPREAQPVGPRTTLNYDGTFDTTCAHCGGNGCFACLKSAAPTPERADAEKDAALPDWRIADGWHNTFSTSNPYCPCDLKSFTKAVRWAERAILATNKK